MCIFEKDSENDSLTNQVKNFADVYGGNVQGLVALLNINGIYRKEYNHLKIIDWIYKNKKEELTLEELEMKINLKPKSMKMKNFLRNLRTKNILNIIYNRENHKFRYYDLSKKHILPLLNKVFINVKPDTNFYEVEFKDIFNNNIDLMKKYNLHTYFELSFIYSLYQKEIKKTQINK